MFISGYANTENVFYCLNNQSFLTGSIPDNLKVALVTLVFKANDREEFSNYRHNLCAPMFQLNIRETNVQ